MKEALADFAQHIPLWVPLSILTGFFAYALLYVAYGITQVVKNEKKMSKWRKTGYGCTVSLYKGVNPSSDQLANGKKFITQDQAKRIEDIICERYKQL